MTDMPVSAELVAECNAREEAALEEDYSALKARLARRGIDADAVLDKVKTWSVAVPN